MDRSEWIRAKRRSNQEDYDTLYAPIYDESPWGSVISPTHTAFFNRFLALCPPRGIVLDAACGTGKYWPLILASGRSVVGVDQSSGMLQRARAKYPDARLEQGELQELPDRHAFEAACCMDALEHIFPEDWPLVLANLYRALRPGGPFYFTVEIATEADIAHAFAAGQQMGLPVVYGEWAHAGAYHYYPPIEQARTWAVQAGFRLVDEAVGDEYHHFLLQKPG